MRVIPATPELVRFTGQTALAERGDAVCSTTWSGPVKEFSMSKEWSSARLPIAGESIWRRPADRDFYIEREKNRVVGSIYKGRSTAF